MSQKPGRIVILGAGPTGLGAAYRLHELGYGGSVHIVDRAIEAGGLSRSIRDEHGFLWDLGGHVIFSHYEYFNRVLDAHVPEWNTKKRTSHVWIDNRFVPYPLQNSVHHLSEAMQAACLLGLQQRGTPQGASAQVDFDRWISSTFGEGLGDAFMRPYNRKVWTVEPREMSSGWVGERVAVPNVAAITQACLQAAAQGGPGDAADTAWGPNSTFRYPAKGGTGAIWRAVAASLPAGWLQTRREVTGIDLGERRVHLSDLRRSRTTSLRFDALINTLPVDRLLHLTGLQGTALSASPRYSSTVVVGVGLRGQPPEALKDRCWLYFPQSDIPFYRLTVFSNYSDDHVPAPGQTWSVMCEIAHKPQEPVDVAALVEDVVAALADKLAWVRREDVVSKWHTQLEYGYPIPYMGRDEALDPILKILESDCNIFSRGRFGAWKYEVANQDHSFMQGVEAAERILSGAPERTVWRPNEVNGAYQTMFTLKMETPKIRPVPSLDVVVAHYQENLSWLAGHGSQAIVYTKGNQALPYSIFPRQCELPNIGRESHTYLQHIVDQYDNLAEFTLFSQGRIEDSVDGYSSLEALLERVRGASGDVVIFRNPTFFMEWGGVTHVGPWAVEKQRGIMRTSQMTPQQFWIWMFDGAPAPPFVPCVWSATLAVRRSAIHRRPRAFYGRLLGFFAGLDHVNPEEGHYMERFWLSIFGPLGASRGLPAVGLVDG